MSKCIFCGDPANSKEHAWPDWLLKLLKDWADERVAIEAHRENELPTSWGGVNAAIKFKSVCQVKCNAGWMSTLEDQARPVLTKMIKGNTTTLSSLEQLTIAAWTIKCAMLFDSQKRPSSDIFYDGLDRSHFRETLTPVGSTRIWIGRYSGTAVRAFTNGKTLTDEHASGRSPLKKCHIETLAFGHLVIQSLSMKRLVLHPSRSSDIALVPGPWQQTTIEIYPVNVLPVQWPPSLSFDDSQCTLQQFANRFNVSSVS